MRITMTMKEMAAYVGMGLEISGIEASVAEAMKDVFSLAGDPQKYGFTEVGIDSNMDIYMEIDPKATVKITDIFTKYIKAVMPLIKGFIATISGLHEGLEKDMKELSSMFTSEPVDKKDETDFRETTDTNPVSETSEDFSEVENSEVKSYAISTIDFYEEEEVVFKKWYNEEAIDFTDLASHETMDVYLKGIKYAKIVTERKLGETSLIISDFGYYRCPDHDRVKFKSKLFNKVTTTLEEKGFNIQLDENLAKELAEEKIIKLG